MAQRKTRGYWDDAYMVEEPTGRHASRSAVSYHIQAQPLPQDDIPVYPKPFQKPMPQRPISPPAPGGTARNLRKTKAHFSAGRMLFAGLILCLMVAMVSMNLAQWGEARDTQKQIDTMKRRIANMQEDNARLQDDIKYTMDGEKIRTYAVNKMGMRPPSDEQTRYITLDGTMTETAP